MTAAKNVGMWHRGFERGAEVLDKAWRRADLCQFNVRRASARLEELYSSHEYDLVLFCIFDVVSICLLPAIYDK